MSYHTRNRTLASRAPRSHLFSTLASYQTLLTYCCRCVWPCSYTELAFTDTIIGEGAFGVVKLALFRREAVAVKTIRSTRISKESVKCFLAELKLMAPLNHPNLVRLLGGVWDAGPDKLCLVLEFCEKGSLKSMFSEGGGYTWDNTWNKIAVGIARCFRYLHHEQQSGDPILHRDLKADNVLVTSDLEAKVADFGESTKFQTDEHVGVGVGKTTDGEATINQRVSTMTIVGTPMYAAPEVLAGESYNSMCDVYSFAITLLVIAEGSQSKILKRFEIRRVRSSAPPACLGWRPKPSPELALQQPELCHLIKLCWDAKLESRPNFKQICDSLEALPSQADSAAGATPAGYISSAAAGSTGNETDVSCLLSLKDIVLKTEIESVQRLRRIFGRKVAHNEQPVHVGGTIAMLRVVRQTRFDDRDSGELPSVLQSILLHRKEHRK